MITLSKREEKLITSLRQKKYRDQQSLFMAEGEKVISGLLPFFEPEFIVSTGEVLPFPTISKEKYRQGLPDQFKRCSLLQSPSSLIAIFKKNVSLPTLDLKKVAGEEFVVALDNVQDPGNMGTIIRLCDWMGIRHLLLGSGCADPTSPKVVQATAGALGNVHFYEGEDLVSLLSTLPKEVNIIGTSLGGTAINRGQERLQKGIVLFGNEGHGIDSKLLELCSHQLLIPKAKTAISDSLNVSISAAIILSYFRELQ